MLESLNLILEIQELDIKMIRLMRLKKERKKERDQIHSIEMGLEKQEKAKELEVADIKKLIKVGEAEVLEVQERLAKLDNQQHSIKKVDEFNALSHEMAAATKDKAAREARLSDLYDKLTQEEDLLKTLAETVKSTKANGETLLAEIATTLEEINREGSALLQERETLAENADPEIMRIYDRLLNNKKDRVIVPIENRACSGCHIVVTAQDENLVRKGERLVFCEHCSRIQYWPTAVPSSEEEGKAPKRRRRTLAKA
jgi:Zn-ribbon protein, possibly nucleic acid-binding